MMMMCCMGDCSHHRRTDEQTDRFATTASRTKFGTRPPPLSAWLAHSASFCLGAAAAASAGILLLRSSSESRPAAAIPAKAASGVGAIVGGERRTRGDGGDNAVVVSGTARPLAATAATAICDMLPSPPVRIFVPNDDLAIAYDSRTKNPLYVVERLVVVRDDAVDRASSSSSSSSRQLRSGMRFREEKSLCPNHRSRNSDYRGSGYDRGHLAPAADFAVAARDDDDDDDDDNDNDNDDGGGDVSGRGRRRRGRMDDTFALTNVSPQVPRFNRTTWLRLEEFVRREARRGLQAEEGGGGKSESEANEANEGGRRSRGETWVVTGPLWLPRHYPPSAKNDDGAGGGGGAAFRYSYVGIGRPPSLVAVPTHFYKVVVVIDDPPPGEPSSEGGEGGGDADATTAGAPASLRRFAAFVLPNSDPAAGDGATPDRRGMRLADHVVRLTDLEAVTGIEFFPGLFGSYVNDGTDDVPVRKAIADALTNEVIVRRLRGGRGGQDGVDGGRWGGGGGRRGSCAIILPSRFGIFARITKTALSFSVFKLPRLLYMLIPVCAQLHYA